MDMVAAKKTSPGQIKDVNVTTFWQTPLKLDGKLID